MRGAGEVCIDYLALCEMYAGDAFFAQQEVDFFLVGIFIARF